jgi:hypothetical protein
MMGNDVSMENPPPTSQVQGSLTMVFVYSRYDFGLTSNGISLKLRSAVLKFYHRDGLPAL